MKEHLIPIPWCFEAKNCTQEQWEIIKKYRAEVTKTDVKLTEARIICFPIGYYVGINDDNSITAYNMQKHFGPNTKLYEPQEIVDIIQGNKIEGEVVHCTTQEQWDLVLAQFNPRNLTSKSFNTYGEDSCICIKTNEYTVGNQGDIQFCKESNHRILSFSEWCAKYGHKNPFEEKKEFKKGDYYVTLYDSPDGGASARKDHCFKQREDFSYIRPVLDVQGSTQNGNSGFQFHQQNWRYATPEEISEYDRLGKPYDITTLKKETKLTPDNLVQGKVYYVIENKSNDFWLLKHGIQGFIYNDGYALSKEFYHSLSSYTYQEATPEQVKHFEACVKAGKYVELDEVEEIKPWSIGTYVVALKDKAISIRPWYKGGIAEVISKGGIKLLMNADIWSCNSKDEEKGLVKWFATRKEAEEFSKTLINVDDIPEYVECISSVNSNQNPKVGQIIKADVHGNLHGICIYKSQTYNDCFRPSTKEAYEQQQRPKVQFIVGKWYKYDNWYLKYSHYTAGKIWVSSEHIKEDGRYEKRLANFGYDNNKQLLTDLSEIQQYLPDGHPDKIIKEEDWCVRLTQENRDIIKDWMDDQIYAYSIDAYYGIKNGAKFGTVSSFGKILTTERFLEKIGKTVGGPEYKVGDWIYTLPESGGWGMVFQDECKVFKILHVRNRLELDPDSNSTTRTEGCLTVRPQDVRKATLNEIQESQGLIKKGYKPVTTDSLAETASKMAIDYHASHDALSREIERQRLFMTTGIYVTGYNKNMPEIHTKPEELRDYYKKKKVVASLDSIKFMNINI